MTQKSWPWSTVAGLGDGAAELNEALSREFLALYFGVQDPTVEGVCKGLSIGELEVSGIATPLSVDPGAAICYGLYISDAIVTLAVSIPAVGTTGGRVVLQTNWAGTGGAGLEARTRLAVKMSADGNPAFPNLTQTFGVTWEIPLASFTVTTGGVITLWDYRTFRRSTAMVDTDELIDLAVSTDKLAGDAVTDVKLRESTAYSVIGRSTGIAGNPADIAAGVDGHVLRLAAPSLGFGEVGTAGIANLAVTEGKIGALAVTTGKIANDSVDDTKAGNRVPQFYRRQGGNAAAWSIAGNNNYTPTMVRMQAGQNVTDGSGDCKITFPQAFSNTPIVIVSSWNDGTGVFAQVCIDDISATTFDVESFDASGVKADGIYFNWFAVGPE